MTTVEALCIIHRGVNSPEEREVYKKASRILWLEGSRVMLEERMLLVRKKIDALGTNAAGER